MSYALGVEGKDANYVQNLHNDGLYNKAEVIFSKFWESQLGSGRDL